VRRDDDDLPGEGRRSGGDPSWADSLVVPDDISALDAEVRALRRERRAAARGRRLRRVFPLHRLSAPVVVVVLVLAAGVTGLILLFQPRRPVASPAAPLATSSARIGQAGGLVPDVPLTFADGSTRSVRDYRPAVLALVPTGCACDAALRESSLAAARHRVTFLLVDRTAPGPTVTRGDRGTILRGTDPTGALARTYGASAEQAHAAGSPVLVLVSGDGRVARVLAEAADRRTLDSELAALQVTAVATP
jgi:hypothetical protein